MKKIIAFGLISMGAILPVKAQIYVPGGAIQGTSINNNVGIGTNQSVAKLTVQAGPDGYPTPLKAISIWGPNSPANSNSAQDLSWDFAAAGSASIRSYRGGDWDTYFQFLTNSNFGGNAPQVRMHIGSDGNVGIGTTNPTQKLDIIGTIKSYETTPLGASSNSFQLINEKGGSVGENRMINRLWLLRDGPLNNWFAARLHDGISVDTSFGIPSVDTRAWWERDPYDNIQSWGNAGETYLTINKGNIGIGTINPSSNLHIYSASSPANTLTGQLQVGGSYNIMDDIYLSIGTHKNGEYAFINGGKGGIGNIPLALMGGNVGIGTTTPDEKLTVKGKIHVQEVKVDLLGALVPDYVFANDYKLKTLQEVEDYIKKNSHLPEIPSAKEFEKNGLMLAEMNMSLLKKIEEQTLYMIEMNKQLVELKRQMDKLKK